MVWDQNDCCFSLLYLTSSEESIHVCLGIYDIHMQSDEVSDYWCRDGEGGISRPGKRKVVTQLSRSDIRVHAALANSGMCYIIVHCTS